MSGTGTTVTPPAGILLATQVLMPSGDAYYPDDDIQTVVDNIAAAIGVLPAAAIITADGAIPFAANESMGGFILVDLGAGSAVGHSLRYEQLFNASGITLLGPLTVAGVVAGVAVPTASGHAARFDDLAEKALYMPTSGQSVTTGADRYAPREGALAIQTANTSVRVPWCSAYDYVFRNMQINVTANSTPISPGGDGTLYLQDNGSDTALTATITGATTGKFDSGIGHVSVAAGHDICFHIKGGTGGTTVFTWIRVEAYRI